MKERIISIIESIPLNELKEFEKSSKRIPYLDKLVQILGKENLLKLIDEQIILYDIKQNTMKLAGNSQYGALGTKSCRLYNPNIATAITSQGVEIITMVQNEIEELGYKVLYGDTDSMFIKIEQYIPDEYKQDLQKCREYINSEIIPKIYQYINPLLDHFAIKVGIKGKHYFEMKQEMIAKKMLLMKDRSGKGFAKKRYIVHIIDEETIPVDKIKAVGVEIRRSELPKFIKDELYSFVETILKYYNENSKDILLDKLINFRYKLIDKIKQRDIYSFGRLISVDDLSKYKDLKRVQQGYGTYLWNTYIAPSLNVPYIEFGQKVLITYIKLKPFNNTNHILYQYYSELRNNNISYLVFNPLVPLEKVIPLFDFIEFDLNKILDVMFYSQIKPYLDTLNIDISELDQKLLLQNII